MTKNLFFMFLLFLGTAQLQATNKTGNNFTESAFTIPTNLTVSNITYTSADITWDPVPGATGYLVRWRASTSSVWTTMNIPAGTTSVNLNSLIPCTGYILEVIDTASGDVSFPLSFYTYLNYCKSMSTMLGALYLSNVTIIPSGGLPTMVSASSATNHTDFRPDLTRRIQLGLGSAGNVISVQPSWSGTPGTAYIRAWIDFNANEIFESSEMMISTVVDSTNPKSFVFNVPPFATIAQCGTAMRVMISQDMPGGPCGTFTYGEVEDYGVTFVNTNLAVNETTKSKEFSVYPNPVSDVLQISGLSEETDYEIYSLTGQKTGEGRTSANKLDVSHLAKGIYFIRFKNKETITRFKFIKK